MAPPPAPRLFLIDGYALIYRSFFALGREPLRNARGENTSIAKGASDFLARLIEKHRPEYLGWVHDAGLSFRHELYPEYKATRERLEPEQQQDFDAGVERVEQLLKAYRVPLLELEGYEADDVIGTLARQASAAGVNAVIVSGDKDFMQLVGPGTWILNPWHGRPGATTEKWYDKASAHERLGVPAKHVIDYLALVGDTSDNVPGVKGIGDKGACELIARFGGLEEIIAHAGEITQTRYRNALLQHAEAGRLSRTLVTIREDLPIAFDPESLKLETPDWSALRDLFVELDFKTAARTAGAKVEGGAESAAASSDAAPSASPTIDVPPAPPTNYRLVTDTTALAALVERMRAVGAIAFDTETVLEPGAPPIITPLRAQLVGISIAVAPGEAYYLPFAHRTPESAQGGLALGDAPVAPAKAPRGALESIAARRLAEGPSVVVNLPPLLDEACAGLVAVLEDAAIKKTAHHAKYDLLVLRRAGVTVRGIDFDSMLVSYVLNPGRRSHAIDALALELLHRSMTGYDELVGKGKAQLSFDVVPLDCARDYSCADADLALQLRALLEPRLESQQLTGLLREMELPLVAVLADMETAGVRIDLPWFASLKERFSRERAEAERAIWAEAGEEFNVASNKQLGAILFGKLGLPVRKKTSTGPSTDASVLQELADEGHRLPELLMEYRELAKLESTYIDTLPLLVDPRDGRLHTSYNQTVASTGRLSSSDPNLQNIPIRRQLGKDIRRGFIPRDGWHFLAADYSQIELRLLAHLSKDQAFVDAFHAGGDIHRQTAAIIFDVPLDAVTSEMRGRAKTINFATIYGQGPHALSRQLKVEHAEAKAFIARYFERFAGVRAFLDASVAQARERGWVETIFQRRRYIPEINDRNFNIRAFGERLAQNSPIQGSAADLIKVAMLRVHERLGREGRASRMLLQVHDELVFECPPAELEAMRAVVEEEMTTAVRLDVPLVVDVGVGDDWLTAKG
ncbi:MAG: DNA polymerase I [Gemmatimonadaceae bacterium]|nr:DNA polymerase I [Gemmatimonadaceae bacterium]